jgi:hypothetical protein
MGFLDSIGTVVSRVVPAAIGFATGGPVGAFTAAAGVERAKKNEKILERNMIYTQEGSSTRSFQGGVSPMVGQAASPGFFAQGGALRTGLRDFGGFLGDFAPVAGVFGLGDRFTNAPPSGAQTINRQAPDETSTSGEILGANLGMGGALVSAGRQLFRSPGGQTALGFGAGAIGSALMGGPDSRVRITRRMKSDVRKIYMMAGMDPNATAAILNNLGTYPRMNFDASLVFFILTKRFRNDGPVVTKAAVRKTKTTLRRMKGVVDMYNSVCKPTTRRAPMRRAAPKAVQLIKN